MIAPVAGGRQFDDALAAELAAEPALTLLCGRYEGFDERVNEHLATDVVSIGPYVLSGGELAAMVVADAVMRKLPGALGHEDSAVEESFSEALDGAPEYPHYTRPFDWRGHAVPEILLSGDHARIREWRLEQSRSRALRGERRPRAFATMVALHARRLPAVAPFVPMSGVIDSLERAQLRRVPAFQAGDRVRVHFQVVEGTRRRTQVFEGIVIKRQGSGARETFTVRKQSFGVGVERTFPVHSPKIERIEVAARGDVRRAKLYYLRDRVGRAARVRERRWTGPRRHRAGLTVEEGAMPAGRRPAPRRGGARRGGRRRRGRGRGGRAPRRAPRRGGRAERARPRRPTEATPRRAEPASRRSRRRRRAAKLADGGRRRRPRGRAAREEARAATRCSSWSPSSPSRSGSRSASRRSSSSRSGSRASRWCRRSRSASGCSSTG